MNIICKLSQSGWAKTLAREHDIGLLRSGSGNAVLPNLGSYVQRLEEKLSNSTGI